MKERHSYVGKLNGVSGVWCDQRPEGLELTKEIVFFSPDEGKVFADKDGNLVDSVVIDENTKIEDFVEIKDTRLTEEPKEENNEERNAE